MTLRRALAYVNQIMTELAVAVGFVAIAWMAVNGVTDPNVGPYGAIIALGGGKLAKDYLGRRAAPSPSRPAKAGEEEA